MTPRDRRAVKFLAEHFGIPLKDFDPMRDDKQADDIAKRLGLIVSSGKLLPFYAPHHRKGKKPLDPLGGVGEFGWTVRKREGEEPFYTLTGDGTRNAAIVNAACIAINPDWSDD